MVYGRSDREGLLLAARRVLVADREPMRMNASKRPAIALAGVVLMFAPIVSAQETDQGVALSWVRGDGAAQCPADTVIRERVVRRLGRDPFHAPIENHIEAVVTVDRGEIVAHIYYRRPDGSLVSDRELRSAALDCGSLADASSLAIAIAIDPAAALRVQAAESPAPSSSPPPSEIPSSSPPPTEIHSSSPPPHPAVTMTPARPHAEVSARADFLITAGLLPNLAPGASVGAEVVYFERHRFPIAIAFVPETTLVTQGHRFAFGMAAASIGYCYALIAVPRTNLSGCAAWWMGGIHAVVFDLTPSTPGERFWTALSVGARWNLTLVRPLSLSIELAAMVPLTRFQFAVAGAIGNVYTQESVALLGQIGLDVRFW